MLNPNYVIDVTMQKVQEFTKNTVVQEATIKQLNDELIKTSEELKTVSDLLQKAKEKLAENGLSIEEQTETEQ
jgi:hypothetical protein